MSSENTNLVEELLNMKVRSDNESSSDESDDSSEDYEATIRELEYKVQSYKDQSTFLLVILIYVLILYFFVAADSQLNPYNFYSL